jgi:N6-adenosine-specific RNA methylase IME4
MEGCVVRLYKLIMTNQTKLTRSVSKELPKTVPVDQRFALCFSWFFPNQIREHLEVFDRWGFKATRIITWKCPGENGFINGFESGVSLCLVGVRGNLWEQETQEWAIPAIIVEEPHPIYHLPAKFVKMAERTGLTPRLEIGGMSVWDGWDCIVR